MINDVVVAVDGSEPAGRACDLASDLAGRLDAKLAVLHVIKNPGTLRVPEEFRELVRDEHVEITERYLARSTANEIVNKAKRRALAQGAKEVETIVDVGDPAAKIIETADRRGTDLIVIGGRGRSDLTSMIFGSVSHKVSHLAGCACVIVK